MVRDARDQPPGAQDDRDQARSTWLASFFRRLQQAIALEADAARGSGEQTRTARRSKGQPPGVTEPEAKPVVTVETATPSRELPPTGLEPAAVPAPAEPPMVRLRRVLNSNSAELRYGVPFVIAVLVAYFSVRTHFGGVDWGDDWSLYVHQAKGLVVGNVGEVLAETRFTVDNSGASTFSPYSYPWGWPLLMAPVYAIFGLDYDALKFLEVLALCIFLIAFFAILRRRTGIMPATILTLLIGVSRAFNGATDTILSDLPYLCFVGISLWWMDRCRERGLLAVGRRSLVILGLLLAFTANIRREGFIIVAPLTALHITVLARMVGQSRSVQALRGVDWRRLAAPYVTFAVAVVLFQMVLPREIKPNAPGTSVANIRPHLTYYEDILAEHVGLKDPGVPMQLFHSESAARFALGVLVILAVVGLITRLVYRPEEDVHLAAFLVCSSFVTLVSPYHESRFFFTVTPFLLYFAYQALPTVARVVSPRNRNLSRIAAVPPALAAFGLVMLCWSDLSHALDYHRHYHYTVNGPETAEAKEMFAAVKQVTRGDDVLLFARARVMTLYTDRSAIQGSNLDLLLPRSDWYVMEKESTYWQTPLNDDQAAARGLKKAWESRLFVIWQVPPRAT